MKFIPYACSSYVDTVVGHRLNLNDLEEKKAGKIRKPGTHPLFISPFLEKKNTSVLIVKEGRLSCVYPARSLPRKRGLHRACIAL